MAKKTVSPKTPIPEGSMAITPFAFELGDLNKIIEECQERRLWSMAFALRAIHDKIIKSRNAYKWQD